MKRLVVVAVSLMLILTGAEAIGQEPQPTRSKDKSEVTKQQYRKAKKRHGKKKVNRRKYRWVLIATSRQQQTAEGQNRCAKKTWLSGGENLLGWDMFRLRQTASWCWNGNRITEIKWRKGIWTTWWTNWVYKQIVDDVRFRKPKRAGQYIQAQFQSCWLWYCMTKQPWHDTVVFKDGWTRHDWGLD